MGVENNGMLVVILELENDYTGVRGVEGSRVGGLDFLLGLAISYVCLICCIASEGGVELT
jgi:hypothetical protein